MSYCERSKSASLVPRQCIITFNALDALGRATNYSEYNTSGTSVYSRSATYDANSLVVNDTVSVVRGDGNWVNTTAYGYSDARGYEGGVTTSASTSVTRNGQWQQGSSLTYTYVWWEGAQQA